MMPNVVSTETVLQRKIALSMILSIVPLELPRKKELWFFNFKAGKLTENSDMEGSVGR
jgi:hypothetical protein